MNFKFDEALGFLLYVVSAKFKNELNHALLPYDITTEQWAILVRLWEGEGKTQKQLAEKAEKDEPNVGRILKKLEAKGLIVRQSDPKDGRIILVFLTQKGMQLEEKLVPLAIDILARAEQCFTKEEFQTLKSLLKRLMDNW